MRQRNWPAWPQFDRRTEELLLEALHSNRWGIGGKYDGSPLQNVRFEEAFAEFHSVRYSLTVANGSAGLEIALEALGIGLGDEIIIPGLAWISCATAATRIGAIPILVDIDPETLSISADAARRAVTDRTKAIMIVHAYCTVADLDAFVQLSEATGIPLVEDCSQAHGAQWRNRRVGTYGKLGVFSMGNSKVLSCGEGGAIITNERALYDVLQELRGDGYRYRQSPPRSGESQLEEHGAVQGNNYCLSEFQAAVLLGGLANLDQQNAVREQNGEYFRE